MYLYCTVIYVYNVPLFMFIMYRYVYIFLASSFRSSSPQYCDESFQICRDCETMRDDCAQMNTSHTCAHYCSGKTIIEKIENGNTVDLVIMELVGCVFYL